MAQARPSSRSTLFPTQPRSSLATLLGGFVDITLAQCLGSRACDRRSLLVATELRDPAGVHVPIHSDVCPTSASGARAGDRSARFMSLHTDKDPDRVEAINVARQAFE